MDIVDLIFFFIFERINPILYSNPKPMKKLIYLLLLTLFLPFVLKAQDVKPNSIKSGFYILLGPVFPVGEYATGQTITFHPKDHALPYPQKLTYLPAKMGAAMDMGYLIYIGPAFANNILRAGIDATFLSPGSILPARTPLIKELNSITALRDRNSGR